MNRRRATAEGDVMEDAHDALFNLWVPERVEGSHLLGCCKLNERHACIIRANSEAFDDARSKLLLSLEGLFDAARRVHDEEEVD